MEDIEIFTVPIQWEETYKKLLLLMTNNALDVIQDCDKSCKSTNMRLVECWNIFQSACCAVKLDMTSEANFLYKYVTEQLNLIYKLNITVVPLEVINPLTDEQIDNITNE